MKLSLFGASGNLGLACAEKALTLGHELTVLVRDASRFPLEPSAKLKILEGSVLNKADVSRAISENTDAVLFTLGLKAKSPKDLCTEASKVIVSAMQEKKLRRFVFASGASTLLPGEHYGLGLAFIKGFASCFMKEKHLDKERQLQFLMQTKDIDWTGLRPAKISAKAKGKPYKLGRISMGPLASIAFADCAKAMLDLVQDKEWIQKMPFIRY